MWFELLRKKNALWWDKEATLSFTVFVNCRPDVKHSIAIKVFMIMKTKQVGLLHLSDSISLCPHHIKQKN